MFALLATIFNPAADPLAVPEVLGLLELQSGFVLHRLAALLRLTVPAPTRETYAGYGTLKQNSEVIAPLASRLRKVLKAYHTLAPAPSAVPVVTTATLGNTPATGYGGRGRGRYSPYLAFARLCASPCRTFAARLRTRSAGVQ